MNFNTTFDQIPSDLFVHPDISFLPPVEANEQDLPIDKLSWKNFEKLCLRLARKESDPTGCRLYGVRGQKQDGIDIYGKIKHEDKYNVYQCKHEDNFSPSKIRDAVKLFLDGAWASRAKKFVICCKDSFNNVQREKEIEIQRERLQQNGIVFETWDYDELNLKLKHYPEIVYDFFGENWVRVFFGSDIAANFKNKLSPIEVTEYIKSCHNLYEILFQKADPGIPFISEVQLNDVPIVDRFVMPSISVEENLTIYVKEGNQANDDVYKYDDPEKFQNKNRDLTTNILSDKIQSPIEWLQSADRFIISGDAGSGKSTLLRYLILNVLNPAPKDNTAAKIWGDRLPIWLPFAFWTKILNDPQGEKASLDEIIKMWLKSWNEEKIWPLFEKALNDEKVLIIIDGIDEGYSLETSKVALNKLDVFLDRRRNASCVISLRPHAQNLLRGSFDQSKWKLGNILGFTDQQKLEYAKMWFSIYLNKIAVKRNLFETTIDNEISKRSNEFILELNKSSDLAKLSSNPLMLAVLFVHKISNVSLPTDRLKIYESLVGQLVKQHPLNRKISSNVVDTSKDFDDSDVVRAISYAAYCMISDSVITVSKEKMVHLLIDFLVAEDFGFSYERSEARVLARELFKIVTEEVSIINEKHPDFFGFIHKSFLEYFAALHVFNLPFQEQKKLIEEKILHSTWHPTFVFLLLSYDRVDEIRSIIKHLMSLLHGDPLERKMVVLILKDYISFSKRIPLNESFAILNLFIDEIELTDNLNYRLSVLEGFMRQVFNPRLGDFIASKMNEWAISYSSWRHSEISSLKDSFIIDEDFVRYLKRGLYDESIYNKRAAAVSLVEIGKHIADVKGYILQCMLFSEDIEIRASCFVALIEDGIKVDDVNKFIQINENSENPILYLMCILGRVHQGIILEEDFVGLIQHTKFSGFGYEWNDLVHLVLQKGWGTDIKLKKVCLDGLLKIGPNRFNSEIASKILIEKFSDHEDVHSWILKELDEKYPFSALHHHAFKLLLKNLKPTPELISKIDDWIEAQVYDEPEVSFAARITKTERAKKQLIKNLESSVAFWSSSALLDIWRGHGAEEIIFEYFNKNDRLASNLAEEYIQVENNLQTAKGKLIALIDSPEKGIRYDIIASALLKIDKLKFDEESIAALLKVTKKNTSFSIEGVINLLIKFGSWHEDVKRLAVVHFNERYSNLSPFIVSSDIDLQTKSEILKRLFPLDLESRKYITCFLRDNSSNISENVFKKIFIRFKTEEDDDVLTNLYIGYYSNPFIANQITDEEVKELEESIFARGMTYGAVRVAALSGLIAVGLSKNILHAKSPYESDKDVLSLDKMSRSQHSNLTLYLIQKWDEVKSAIGERFDSLFLLNNDLGLNYKQFLPYIVDEKSPVFEDVLFQVKLALDEDQKIDLDELEFLIRFNIKNEKIDKIITDLLLKFDRGYGSDALRLGLAFSKHFSPDSTSMKFLKENIYHSSWLNEGCAIALCELFPDSEEVLELHKYRRDNRIPTGWELATRLNAIAESAEYLYQLFSDVTIGKYSGDKYISSIVYRHLLQALSRREECLVLFENRLEQGDLHYSVELNLMALLSKVRPEKFENMYDLLNAQTHRVTIAGNSETVIWNLQFREWLTVKQTITRLILPIRISRYNE